MQRKPPKVAHVVLTLNAGGIERFLCGLTACPELKSVEQVVCCIDERGILAPDVEHNGVPVFVEQRRGRGFDFALIFRLTQFLRREKVSVVHTHSLDPMLYVALAAALARVPVRVHTQHNAFLSSCSARDRWKFQFAARWFTHLVAVSDQARGDMLRLGARPECTWAILNGIDVKVAPPPRVPRDRELVIGFVGRLAREKAVDRLLIAFARLRERYPMVRLRIAGDGPERSSLERLAVELGVAQAVEFTGFVRDVPGVLAGLDIFVIPSLTEGIPLALLEAMASQLPVIATAVGGMPEVVVDMVSGLLVPPDDVPALAAAVARLVQSKSLRASLAEGARARVESKFNLARMAWAYLSIYVEEPESAWKTATKRLLRWLPPRLIIWRSPDQSGIALTFDDGPDEFTARLLDVLKQYNARATFFLVGKRVPGNEAIIERIVAEGHEIGNHSFSHPDFEKLPFGDAASEIRKGGAVLAGVLGNSPKFFRPPKGKLSAGSLLGAWRQRLSIAMWSVDLKDFQARGPEEILAALARHPLGPGDVVLYHGNNEPALAALPRVLESALATGQPLVSISELTKGVPVR